MRTPRRITVVVPIVLTGWLLAGCGSERAATDQETTSSSSATTEDPAPSEDPTVLPTDEPSGTTLSLRGTVEPGVEAGCHLLTAGGATYQLIWATGELVDGQRVEVVGAVRADLMTTCQQGVPFVVERIEPAPDQAP